MRSTEERKDLTIKIRLTDDMRKYIEHSAYGNGITMSEYLWKLILADMSRK